MGTVLTYSPEQWLAMLCVKSSLRWYEAQPRDNDKYGTATRKEKKLLKYMINEAYEEAA